MLVLPRLVWQFAQNEHGARADSWPLGRRSVSGLVPQRAEDAEPEAESSRKSGTGGQRGLCR